MNDRLPLTERQSQVLQVIRKSIEELGYPPTIREIGESLGIRSTNGVGQHLKALKRKGYLSQAHQKSRALKLTEDPDDSSLLSAPFVGLETVSVPILGRVAAGEPILAEEHAQGQVVVDRMLVGRGRNVFALKVVGDSMIEDGILNGDYIFVFNFE